MEVHHHAHSARKKWSHYVWEFLMLFLAVFCGFLAEYQLEHKIEKDRERQFIRSMVSDLRVDALALDNLIEAEKKAAGLLDTLIFFLNNASLARQEGDALYYAARIGPRSAPFANNSRTFDQLKNSGSFRLIRKRNASDRIMGYYTRFSLVRLMEDNYNHEFDNYKRTAARILDAGILRRQEDEAGTIHLSGDNPGLLTYDPVALNEMCFHAIQMNGSRRGKIQMLGELRLGALQLIQMLEDDYHLDSVEGGDK